MIDPLDHTGLVAKMALQCGVPRNMPVEETDEFQDGFLGLQRACALYNPDLINPDTGRPYAFSTYACACIKTWIERGKNEREGRGPGGNRRYWRETYAFSQYKDGELDPKHILTRESVDLVELNDEFDMLYRLIRQLDSRTRDILFRRYFMDMTLQEIADIEGLSRERVRQITDKAIVELRAMAASQSLRP